MLDKLGVCNGVGPQRATVASCGPQRLATGNAAMVVQYSLYTCI